MAGPAFGPASIASSVPIKAATMGAASRQDGAGDGSSSDAGLGAGAAKLVVSGRFMKRLLRRWEVD
jgi:hypothetical protein